MKKTKVLNIVAKLDRGGAEVWLKDIIDSIDKFSFEMHFLRTKAGVGYFDEDFEQNGVILHELRKGNLLKFFIKLYRFCKQNDFDVIHSHLLNFSGPILLIAWLAGIPIRIAHSHSDRSVINSKAVFSRKLYLKFTQLLINIFSSHKIACSNMAGQALFGSKDYILIENGINLAKFKKLSFDQSTDCKYHREFDINNSYKVIGHVGRYSNPKNHIFLVHVIKELILIRKDFRVVLVGEGDLYSRVEAEIKNNNLSNYIIQIGGRDDVPQLMECFFDLFLFPSIYEGMPITLIETQAANLLSLISSSIPQDVIKVPELFSVLDLSLGPKEWAIKIDELLDMNNMFKDGYEIIMKSDLNINISANKIMKIYSKQPI